MDNQQVRNMVVDVFYHYSVTCSTTGVMEAREKVLEALKNSDTIHCEDCKWYDEEYEECGCSHSPLYCGPDLSQIDRIFSCIYAERGDDADEL